jgi:hypothetical protein
MTTLETPIITPVLSESKARRHVTLDQKITPVLPESKANGHVALDQKNGYVFIVSLKRMILFFLNVLIFIFWANFVIKNSSRNPLSFMILRE